MSHMPAAAAPAPSGRVASGSVKVGDAVKVLHHDGSPAEQGRVTRILKRTSGFNKSQLEGASAGDVVELAGLATAGERGCLGWAPGTRAAAGWACLMQFVRRSTSC